jgi:hypothetical protein
MFCGNYIIQDEHGSFANMNLHHYMGTTSGEPSGLDFGSDITAEALEKWKSAGKTKNCAARLRRFASGAGAKFISIADLENGTIPL